MGLWRRRRQKQSPPIPIVGAITQTKDRYCFCGSFLLRDGLMMGQEGRKYVHAEGWCGDPYAALREAGLGVTMLKLE